MKFCLILFSLLVVEGYYSILKSQNPVNLSSAEQRLEGHLRKMNDLNLNPLVGLEFESVGPTIMGGRVSDIEVSPTDPSVFYVAYASGGLFYTENNGQSYTALFDNEMVMSIGDIAVDWNNNIIWVGTGECNSSRSSYSGFGIYKSSDGGKTWEHRGLPESHHIARIVLHPDDPEILWVAAVGHLYSPNEERGVFKSSDGGMNWKKVLYIDENTGAIDLIINPVKKDVLYAAMWHRQRRAWDFTESGESSGIYRSGDNGENWRHISGEGSSFAFGEGLGRIGLAITPDGETLYAMLDNQNRRPKISKETSELSSKKLSELSKEEFLKLDVKDLEKYLRKNNFPEEIKSDSIVKLVKSDAITIKDIIDYTDDANRRLFDTEVIGAEVYSSSEYGRNWRKMNTDYLDDLIYTYGYYFGQIRISPFDKNVIYIAGVPILKSEDGGKSFKSINGDNQHVDHHVLWVSPYRKGHLINGNDGGINISYDDGKNWSKLKSPPVGQFYTINVDNAKPYNIYGGTQDNGVWMGPSIYKESSSWENTGNYPYERIMGGDGFNVEIDSRDNTTVYTGYQFGHYFRFNKNGGKRTKITPKHKLGERPLRFNWETPIYLSRHNQDILYFGSNKFHRSLDQGNSYDLVTADMTKGGLEGDVAFGTITNIHESDLKFGLIYLGTDDGLVYRSVDLGYNWDNIIKGLPQNFWVAGIQASSHEISRVYLVLNGYRWDNFEALIYVSDNFGEDWTRLGLNLPMEAVNVLKEDPENENILYLGTDHGLYISLDHGLQFHFINNGIPAVAVHDLVVQKREKELLVATHGRSIYKGNIRELQLLPGIINDKSIHLFRITSVNYREDLGKKYNKWSKEIDNIISVPVYVNNEGIYSLTVSTSNGLELYSKMDTLNAGLNYSTYDLSILEENVSRYNSLLKKDNMELKAGDNGKFYLLPGEYRISIKSADNKIKEEQSFTIKSNEKK